jgi:hypothetical protein
MEAEMKLIVERKIKARRRQVARVVPERQRNLLRLVSQAALHSSLLNSLSDADTTDLSSNRTHKILIPETLLTP